MKKTSPGNTPFFISDTIESNFRPVVIMGVNRSGKTILGNLISTCKNVEHLDEPWMLFVLPILVNQGLINQNIGRELFLTYLNELMSDVILLRRANFRPDDLSSVWLQKTPSEIFSRMLELKSRSDVDNFIKLNTPFFLLNLSESAMCNLSTIVNFLPTSKIIHVIRQGVDVANQIYKKRWFFDEQLIKPNKYQVYHSIKHDGKTLYIPWWVRPEEDRRFLKYSEFERGLFYWCVLMENAAESLKKIENKYFQVRYEDFISDPQKISEQVNTFLGVKPSSMTAAAIKNIYNLNKESKRTPKVTRELLSRMEKIYKYYDYKF